LPNQYIIYNFHAEIQRTRNSVVANLGSEVFVFQRRRLNALALSICLSVRLSCLSDPQRSICLYFSKFNEQEIQLSQTVRAMFSVVSVIGICSYFSEGGLMRWRFPSVCLFVCLVSVIDSEVFVCISAKAA